MDTASAPGTGAGNGSGEPGGAVLGHPLSDGRRRRLVREITASKEQIMEGLLRSGVESLMRTDLTVPQLRLIGLLVLHGECQAHRLADLLRIAPPTLTGLLDRLEAAGMVHRRPDPHDRRARLVTPTPRAVETVRTLVSAPELDPENLIGRLADDDLVALHRGLRALVDVARTLGETERGQGSHAGDTS